MNRRAFRPPRRTMGADGNTDDLLKHAEALGLSCALIEDRDGCPEVLVGGWGGVRLAEIKTRKGKLRERQEKWRKWWRGPPPSLWRTTADVERTVGELRQEAEWKRSLAFEVEAAATKRTETLGVKG